MGEVEQEQVEFFFSQVFCLACFPDTSTYSAVILRVHLELQYCSIPRV